MRLYWGGWGRTSNLPVNSRALCQLSYTPRWDRGIVTLLGGTYGGNPARDHSDSVCVLLLAGGRGSRFEASKLHALYRGKPLLAAALSLLQTAGDRGWIESAAVVLPSLESAKRSCLSMSGGDNPDVDTPADLERLHGASH